MMDLEKLVKKVDADTAKAFVQAARHVIDAMMIEAKRVQQTQTPGARDYRAAGLSREAPPAGWLSAAELDGTTQRLAEAMAAEKWAEGVLLVLRWVSALA